MSNFDLFCQKWPARRVTVKIYDMTHSAKSKPFRHLASDHIWPGTTPSYMKGPLYTHLKEGVHKKVTTFDPVMMRVIQKRVMI